MLDELKMSFKHWPFYFYPINRTRDHVLPPFSLIRDFRKHNTCGNVSKISKMLRVIDMSDRNPPITAASVTV